MSYVFSNLRVLMAERRLNIQDIKNKTNLSRTTISNLVNNNVRGVQFDTVVELCELLNCDIDDLFTLVTFKVFLIPSTKPYDIQEGDDFENIKKIKYKCDLDLYLQYHDTKMEFEVVANVEMRVKDELIFDFRVTLVNEKMDELYHLIRDEYYLTIPEFEKEVLHTLSEHSYEWFDEYIKGNSDTLGITLNYEGD